MIGSLEALRDLLAEAVAESDCIVSDVVVTAGRPAAPSEEGRQCQTVIYVWGDNATDLNQNIDDACAVRARWTMSYEIWTCYPEDWEDQIRSEAAEDAALCLYELMGLAWCALVAAYDSKIPFGGCEDVELQPLTTQNRSGGAVSALGGLTIPYHCASLTSP